MGADQLREGDADLLLRTIDDAWQDDRGGPVPWALLEGLQRLIPCDLDLSYQHHDYRRSDTLFVQGVDDDARHVPFDHDEYNVDGEHFWSLWWHSDCSWPQRSGDLRSVLMTGDFFPTEQARRADPFYELYPEMTDSMTVSLPAAPGEARRLEFQRYHGRAFTERDRQLLVLLRPHLLELCANSGRPGSEPPRLTPREWQVLGMASAGLSFAEIAEHLVVSVSTVRKHMENVRTRLGVHSVAAAAAAVMPYAPFLAPASAPLALLSGGARSAARR